MKNTLAIVLVVILFAVSCKKEDSSSSLNNTTTTFKTYGSIDEIYSLLSLQPKVMQVDAAAGASFYGNSGTRFVFAPNCFIDGAGNTVTGFVQVEVTEYLKKGDMIFGGAIPVSDGEPLISGGEFFAKATKGGAKIFVKPAMGFEVNIPQDNNTDSSMSLFKGDTTGGTTASKVNWGIRKQDSSYYRSIKYVYVPNFQDTIKMICDSFDWWNGDHFRNVTDPQSFKVTVAVSGTATSTVSSLTSFILFDKENGMVALRLPKNNEFDAIGIPRVPVHFVAFGLINGHFYGGVVAATPQTGLNYTVTLTEVDPAAFKAQLNALY